MKLIANEIPCPRCGKPVHGESWVCPYCNATLRHKFLKVLGIALTTILATPLIFCLLVVSLCIKFGDFILSKFRTAKATSQTAADSDNSAAPSLDFLPPGGATPRIRLSVYRSPERLFNFLPLCYRLEFDFTTNSEAGMLSFLSELAALLVPRDVVLFGLHRRGDVSLELLDFFEENEIHHEEDVILKNMALTPFRAFSKRYERLYSSLWMRFNSVAVLGRLLDRLATLPWDEYGLSCITFKNKYAAIFGKFDFDKLSALENFVSPDTQDDPETILATNYGSPAKIAEVNEEWCKDRLMDLDSYCIIHLSRIFQRGQLVFFCGSCYPEPLLGEVQRLAASRGFEAIIGSGYEQLSGINRAEK